MRAIEVLQKCLRDALGSMHALRRRVLLRAVEAMIHGSRLTPNWGPSKLGSESEVSPRFHAGRPS